MFFQIFRSLCSLFGLLNMLMREIESYVISRGNGL